jgi:tetratricopeptide (TPR) repeat protein
MELAAPSKSGLKQAPASRGISSKIRDSAVCNWLIEEASTEVAGYRERSGVKDRMDDLDGAILDLQAVTARFDQEPSDFYTLGKLLLHSGSTTEAILAFDKAVALGQDSGVHYYTNSTLLPRSDANFKQTRYAAALADALRLPPAYATYVPGAGMRTKEEVVTAAKEALHRQEKNRFRMK